MNKLISGLSLLYVGVSTLSAKPNNEKPNILILFSDQHRADVFNFQGNPDVSTPNFDFMGNNGVVFNRAYCQNAISGPSRTSMFTGLYPRTIGYMDNMHPKSTVLDEVVPMQKMFQDNGYITYAFGKRHMEGKADEGWSVVKAHIAAEGKDNYMRWIEDEGFAKEFGEDWAAEFGRFPEGNSLAKTPFETAPMGTRTSKLREKLTMEAYSARNTINIIRKHKKEDKPFFCFTSFYRPHQPYTPLPKYLSQYDASRWGMGTHAGDAIKMPETLRQPKEELPPFLSNQRNSLKGIWCLGKAAQDEQLYRDYIAAYYALVSEIDYWVGEIFKELEKSGMAENTIVIYTADHGDFVGNHGMIEKAAHGHNVYEETLKVPMMFYWKNKLAKRINNEDLVGLIDLYPTLLDLAGIEEPALKHKLQGESMAQTLIENIPMKRTYMVSENWSQASIITKDYKLGHWLNPTPLEGRDWRSWGDMMFEYASDPLEIRNLNKIESMKPLKEHLLNLYTDFETKIPDTGREEFRQRLIRQQNNKKK